MSGTKITKLQKASVEVLIDKWKPVLFLHEWRIELDYSKPVGEHGDACPAQIDVDAVYKHAHLAIFQNFFDRTAEVQDHCILHELCHCITELTKHPAWRVMVREEFIPWRSFKEANETSTQQIANVVFELYRRRKVID